MLRVLAVLLLTTGCTASFHPEYAIQALARDPATVCAVARHTIFWGLYGVTIWFARTNRSGGHVSCHPDGGLEVDDRGIWLAPDDDADGGVAR